LPKGFSAASYAAFLKLPSSGDFIMRFLFAVIFCFLPLAAMSGATTDEVVAGVEKPLLVLRPQAQPLAYGLASKTAIESALKLKSDASFSLLELLPEKPTRLQIQQLDDEASRFQSLLQKLKIPADKIQREKKPSIDTTISAPEIRVFVR
jgi:hypothetical protein